MDNKELIQAAKKGDSEALSSLLMEYRGVVAAAVTRIVFEPEYRKDVIQNVFLKAVAGISGFNGSCRFSTWLYRIAVNESIEYLRKNGKLDSIIDKFDDNSALLPNDFNQPDSLEEISNKQIIKIIGDILNKCPLSEKTAFSLFYYCGYNGKEAAEAMSVSEHNFFMKLKAARDRIRTALKKRGVI